MASHVHSPTIRPAIREFNGKLDRTAPVEVKAGCSALSLMLLSQFSRLFTCCFAAPGQVARHALAKSLDVRHFQPGNLNNLLPDRRVIITMAMVEEMLDPANQVLHPGFVDASSATLDRGAAFAARPQRASRGRPSQFAPRPIRFW